MDKGAICGYVYDMYYGYVYGTWYEGLISRQARSWSSWSLTTIQRRSSRYARVPSEDVVYGYGMCDASSNYCWMQVDPSAPGEYELLLDMPDDRDICYSLCYNPSDDCLYGVTVDQEFVRIARDGTQEILFKIELDNLAYYIAGLVYSPIEGLFHWNPNFYDYTSGHGHDLA